MDEDTLFQTFAINTFGPAYLIARCWPVFVRQRAGRVVNVSSLATIDPFPGLSIYAASKAALESLTRSAWNEGRRHGILPFTVVLGSVETAMLRRVVSEAELPTQRTLDPLEAAAVIVDCVMGRRDGVAGQAILVPSP